MSAFNPFANTNTSAPKPSNPFAKPTPLPAFGGAATNAFAQQQAVAPAFGGAKPPAGVFAAPGTQPMPAPAFGPPPQTAATRGRGGFNVNAAPFKPRGGGAQGNAPVRGGFHGQQAAQGGGFQQHGQRGGFNNTSPVTNGLQRGAPGGMQGQASRGRGGGVGRGGFQGGRGGFGQPAGGFQQQQQHQQNGGFGQQAQTGFPSQPAGGFQQQNGFQTQNTFQQQNGFQQQPPQKPFPQQNAFQTQQQQNPPQTNGFQAQAQGGFGKPQGFQQPQQQKFGAPASSNADVNHFDDNDVLAVLKTTKGRDLKGTFDAMQTRRAAERKRSIAAGLIDDPDNPKPLHMAIEFNGTCHNKCPSHEIIERCYQNMVDNLELDENGIPDVTRFVKRFHRPAAGVENPLPRDVRTPQALKATMEYLVTEVLQNNPLESAHGFVRDRTRGVRQDFVYQNYRLDEAIYCHETIARFHILALHHLAGHQGFDAFQEMEQLRKTLTSLAEYYRDAARDGRFYPSEAEFRAYSVILLARERDVERLVSEWPKRVRDSEEVKLAVQFYEMLQRNSEAPRVKRTGRPEVVHNTPITFFNLVRSEKTPYLMACLLEYHFGDVRRSGLNFINRGYNSRAKRLTLPLLQRWFGYESVEDAREDINSHGFVIAEDPQFGEYFLPTKTITAERQSSSSDQKFHQQLVESKRGDRSLAEILLRERQEPYIEPLPPMNNTNRAVWKLTPLEGQQLDFSELLDQNEIQQLTPMVMNTQVSDNQRVAPVDHGDFGMSAIKAVKRSSEEKEKDMLRKVQAARKAAAAPAPKPAGFGQPAQNPSFPPPAPPQTNAPAPAANPFFAAPATNNTPPTPAPAFAPPQQPAAPNPFQGFKAPEVAPAFTPPSSQTTATPDNTKKGEAEKPASSWFPSSAVTGGAPSTTGGASVFAKPPASASAPASSGTPAASIFSKPAEAPTTSIFSKPAESSPAAAPLFSTSPAPPAPAPAFNPPVPKPAFTGAPLFSSTPATQGKPSFENKGTDPMTPMKPPSTGFTFKSPGGEGKTQEKEEKPAEPPRAPTPEPVETEEQIREREDRAREEEIKQRKRRRLLEFTFYTWLHQIQRIRRLRMAAEKKKKANKPIASQWWPIARDMVPAQKIQHCSERVFKPADTEVWFPEIVEHALQTVGARNRSWKLILHNGDWSGESNYWWHQKFLRGQESITMPLGSGNSFQATTTVLEPDLQSVGALIYGCSPDFSYSTEARYNHDRKHLHEMIDVLTKNTQYPRLVVMVLAYRSPLDDTPADPLAADFTRTMGEARNQRIEAVKSALGFEHFPDAVICKDVIMLETVRDMELSPALRSIAEKFVLATVNPAYAHEFNGAPPDASMQPPPTRPRSTPAPPRPHHSSPPAGSPPLPARGFTLPKRSTRGTGFIAKLRAQPSRSPSLPGTPPPTARKRPPPPSTPPTKRARPTDTPQHALDQVAKAQQYRLLGLQLPRQHLRSAVDREEENVERRGRRRIEADRKRRELEELVRGLEESVGEVRSFVEEADSQSGLGVAEWDDGEGEWSVDGSWLGSLAGA